MQIKYIATKEDFTNFNKIFMKYQNKKLNTVIRIFSFFLLLFFFYFSYQLISFYLEFQTYFKNVGFNQFLHMQMENILWTIGFLVISCILFFEVNILTNFKIKKLINHPENQFFFSEKKLFFSDEKVDIHQEVSESIVQWESFTKIIETKQYLFLFNSSSTGLLIPKKAIPQELYTSLYELFMAKISNQVLIDK